MSRFTHVLLAALVLALNSTAADALKRRAGSAAPTSQDSTLVGLHDLRREGDKTCMSEHTHNGSSTGQPSRKAAEVVAMREWATFTAWEYGAAWGNPNLAGSKTMTCSGGGASYNCDFVARPCRR